MQVQVRDLASKQDRKSSMQILISINHAAAQCAFLQTLQGNDA